MARLRLVVCTAFVIAVAVACGREPTGPFATDTDLLGPGSSGGDSPGSRGPSGIGHGVLLVVIDGLRADHVHAWGYERETTPNLDLIAEAGVRFERTVSPAPWLLPAHAGLLTGCDPMLGWRRAWDGAPGGDGEIAPARRWRLPEDLPGLAVEFLARGYSTAAFADHPLLSPAFGLRRGFQDYTATPDSPNGPDGAGVEALAPHLRSWLAELEGDEPWFAYLHLHDLERAWTALEPEWDGFFEPRPELARIPPVANSEPAFFAVPRSRWSARRSVGAYEARYDGALRRLDHHLGRVFDSLRLIGRLERTTICVVGSHGIQFGEHGLYLTSGTLSASDLWVPWILRPASGVAPFEPGVVSGMASLLDVGPTLLGLSGFNLSAEMQGRSHVAALIDHERAARRRAYAANGLAPGYAVFGEEFAYSMTRPGDAHDPSVVQSWFGDFANHRGESYERMVRWGPRWISDSPDSPDSPDSSGGSAPAVGRAEFEADGMRYYQRMDSIRRTVQTPGAVDRLDEARWLEVLTNAGGSEDT